MVLCAFGQTRQQTRNKLLPRDHPDNACKKYETKWLDVPVDHFAFDMTDTFKMRYLVNKDHWSAGEGPIFFYTGNEGDIEVFCQNTGFMWDIAPEFKALIVFAEHRYYGKTMPYGKQSYDSPKQYGYLTAEQALADYAHLIGHLHSTLTQGSTRSPVIAFGGSYGGMLASWFRMKYPHIVQGAIAGSAPIAWFGDLTPCNSFDKTVTEVFGQYGSCASNIGKSWTELSKMGKTEAGRQSIAKAFHLCKVPESENGVDALKGYMNGAWGNLAMINYPYPTEFLMPVPGWPIKEACKALSKPLDGIALMEGVSKALNVYYNYTGNVKCLDTANAQPAGLDDNGWSVQSCNEMVMPMCSNSESSMFEPAQWSLEGFIKGCQEQWKTTPRPNHIVRQYGGRNIDQFSNIFFSNGKLDPWHSGGILKNVSGSVQAYILEQGAHHLDLRSSNPADTPGAIHVRLMEKQAIREWITQHKEGTCKGVCEDPPFYYTKQGLLFVMLCLMISVLNIGAVGLVLTAWKKKVHHVRVPYPDTHTGRVPVNIYTPTTEILDTSDTKKLISF